MFTTMEKHKEVFFTIRLHSAQGAASLSPITDPDPLMPCELMDGRDAFLAQAREKHFGVRFLPLAVNLTDSIDTCSNSIFWA